MAEAGIRFDVADVLRNLDQFGQQVQEHLPRSMAVAGGKLLRDEAKRRAPKRSGLLAQSIYLAYADDRSSPADGRAVYTISWNASSAPHGHLIEFGHWRYNRAAGNGVWLKSLRPGLRRGRGAQDHVPPGALDKPEWVPAKPFLRPAYDAMAQTAVQAMVERGQQRLAEIMAEMGQKGA